MAKKPKTKRVTEQLREAVIGAGMTRYRLSQLSGVAEPVLCKFVAGAGLRSDSIDALCEALGLELTAKPKTKGK